MRQLKLKEIRMIINALEALGVSADAIIKFGYERLGRTTVYVNGEEFGIYDLHRDTFVD